MSVVSYLQLEDFVKHVGSEEQQLGQINTILKHDL